VARLQEKQQVRKHQDHKEKLREVRRERTRESVDVELVIIHRVSRTSNYEAVDGKCVIPIWKEAKEGHGNRGRLMDGGSDDHCLFKPT
jgi:hypothetical protein